MVSCRDSPSLDEMTPCNEQNGLLGGKIRVLPEPSDGGLFVRDAGFAFMGFRSIFVISKILQRLLSVRGLFFAGRYRREAIRIP